MRKVHCAMSLPKEKYIYIKHKVEVNALALIRKTVQCGEGTGNQQ